MFPESKEVERKPRMPEAGGTMKRDEREREPHKRERHLLKKGNDIFQGKKRNFDFS